MTEDRARLHTLPSRYPRLFPKGPLTYGFELGSGWTFLIEVLCERIDTILKDSSNAKMEVVQVKEKFGRLRFYYDLEGANDAVKSALQQAVRAAEIASAHCCERCGALGCLDDRGGWLSTRCPSCSDQ